LNGGNTTCLSDFAISSYSPTLSALLVSQTEVKPSNPSSPSDMKMLAIIQPNTPGRSSLPGTLDELQRIRDETKNAKVALTVMEGNAATPNTVLEALSASTIVHFACHGIQNVIEPLKSGLLLHDGSLDLATLTNTHLPNVYLAFLSACETAMGDDDLPDEAIHLAAGMLAAGFRSVIATMWAIPDRTAPVVAEEVYRRLFAGEDGTVNIGPGKAAEALHFAVQRLRDEGAKRGSHAFMEWMPFVHYGA